MKYTLASPWNALLPCRVTTLNTAPWTLPYSADAPSWSTCTSSMASVLGQGHAAPVNGAVKSVPSSWYELSVTLLPNACDRELVAVCGLTPAAWLIRSKNVNRRCGAFSTQLRFRFVATCVDAALTTGDSPTTVTVSCSVLTFNCALISTVPPSGTGIFSRRTVENPWSVKETEYSPGGTEGKRKAPSVPVTVVGCPGTLAPCSVAVTPGSTAPDSSV